MRVLIPLLLVIIGIILIAHGWFVSMDCHNGIRVVNRYRWWGGVAWAVIGIWFLFAAVVLAFDGSLT